MKNKWKEMYTKIKAFFMIKKLFYLKITELSIKIKEQNINQNKCNNFKINYSNKTKFFSEI